MNKSILSLLLISVSVMWSGTLGAYAQEKTKGEIFELSVGFGTKCGLPSKGRQYISHDFFVVPSYTFAQDWNVGIPLGVSTLIECKYDGIVSRDISAGYTVGHRMNEIRIGLQQDFGMHHDGRFNTGLYGLVRHPKSRFSCIYLGAGYSHPYQGANGYFYLSAGIGISDFK